MVGLSGDDCSPQLVRTFVAGDNYAAYPELLSGTWFVNPADRAALRSPSGDFGTPCTQVIALAARDASSAAILCDAGEIFTTTDAAASWSEPVTVRGAVNLSSASNGYVVAAVGNPECVGVEIFGVDDTGGATPTGCFPLPVEPASLAGDIAVSQAGDTLWLWAGEKVIRSADGGSTWQ